MTVAYRVRFDECGPDGLARSSSLLRYAQDIAWLHAEAKGFSRTWYLEHGLAWVVRAAELSILAPIPLGATLSITTRVSGFRRVWARRRTEAHLPNGTLAMWGHTDWVIIDGRGQPGRIPPEFAERFAVPQDPFEPGRVRLAPTPPPAVRVPIAVRPQDTDPLGHVNNAAYLDYFEETLLAGSPGAALTTAIPRTIRLEYVAPAAPGAVLDAAAWRSEEDGGGAWAWRLASGATDLARGTVRPAG
jgi:acyl-CoA thioesterase FadM